MAHPSCTAEVGWGVGGIMTSQYSTASLSASVVDPGNKFKVNLKKGLNLERFQLK